MSLSKKVATQFLQKKSVRSSLKVPGEFHAADGSWTLRWTQGHLALMEAPVKGKARSLDPERGGKAVNWHWDWNKSPKIRYPILHNVLPDAGLRVTDTAAQVRAKLERSYEKFLDFLRSKKPSEIADGVDWIPQIEEWLSGTSRSWPSKIDWWKNFVSPSSFVPKNLKPIKVVGKGFEVTVKPDKFEIYSTFNNNLGSDPHFSGWGAKTPAAARKVYNFVVANRNLVEQMNMKEFVSALHRAKIPLESLHSTW